MKKWIWILVAIVLVMSIVGCGGKKESAEDIIKAQEKTLESYYTLIDNKSYRKAYEMTTSAFKGTVTYSNFKYQYSNYLDSVSIQSMRRVNSERTSAVYELSFDAKYKQKYIAGDGNLPTIHVLKKEEGEWRIDSIGIK